MDHSGKSGGVSRSVTAPYRILASVVAVVMSLTVTACGSSSDDDSTSESAGSTQFVEEAKTYLQTGYEGDYQPPPTEGPPAQRGKNVWFISCGQAFEACAVLSSEFQEAGEKLGWNVTIQDGKADPSAASQIIRQAIAAEVDGLVVTTFDCPGVKGALLEAQQAEIPVVNLGSLDCDNEIFDSSDEALYTASAKLRGSDNVLAWWQEWARAKARYTVAVTEGKANILQIFENGQGIQRAAGEAFAEEMAKCTTCKVEPFPFTFAQVPNPFSQQIQSAMLANPDIDEVQNGLDALMFLGLQTAVQQAGRELTIYGSELNPGNVALIRDGQQKSAVSVPFGWFSYASADTLNRVFAGDDPSSFPNHGSGWQFVDQEHNLPPEGQNYEPPVDFKAAYDKIWGQ